MSSSGQILGAIAGAVLGFMTGGLFTAVQYAGYGMSIGGAIDPPKPPATHSFGARLTDLSSQTGTYGQAIPRIYGSMATYGNIFWLENNQLKEVATTEEVESGGKGGGGGEESTNTTYAYYATFAVGLCEGPISGIRRIWIGSQLFYDAGSSDLQSIIASNQKASTFTFYNGSDTQVPNSRMQATLGSTNTPAYRGLAYIVFYDLALKDFGNSLMSAQIKVEVIIATKSYQYYDYYVPYSGSSYWNTDCIYIDNEKAVFAVGRWDNYYPAQSSATMYEYYYYSGNIVQKTVNCYGYVPPPDYFTDDISGYKGAWHAYFDYAGVAPNNEEGKIRQRRDKYVGYFPTYQSKPLMCVSEDGFFSIAASTVMIETDGTYIYTASATHLKKYDFELKLLVSVAVDAPTTLYSIWGDLLYDDLTGKLYLAQNISGGSGSIWSIWEVASDMSGYTLVRSGVESVYPFTYGGGRISNNIFTIVGQRYSGGAREVLIRIINLDSVATNTLPLPTIVQAECLKSKILTINDIDTISLSSQVNGYRITNAGSLRSAIEPVQGAYPFDVYQQGYKIKFKTRGNSPVATIASELLGVRSSGNEIPVILKEERTNDSQLPSKVSISYFDKDREYDRGEQYSERISRPSNNTISIEMPLVLNATEAAKMTDILLYMYWMEKSEFEFTLPASYANLEPTDVITITTPQESYELRITSIGYNSDTIIECKGRINKATAYTSTVTGESGISTGVGMIFSGDMTSLVMDLPCINSDMNRACIGVAATAATGTSWSGGAIYRSDDNGQTWKVVQALSSSSTIGTAINTIGTWNSTRVDYTSGLQVSMISGTLSSVTLSQACNGSNCFAYGENGRWEIIHALTCTLQGDGTYILSDLLRGRAGTEHNTNNHVVGDYLVYLNSGAYSTAVESALIGLTRPYKGVSFGVSLSSVNSTDLIYTGMNLECLSPIYLNGNRHPTTNDWTLNWIRRTRVGGEWKDYVDATLSETSEAYDVEVYTSGYATLKRTISVTSATATYTSANQVTDFGSNQATLYLKIYQKSTTVGQGIPLIASITR